MSYENPAGPSGGSPVNSYFDSYNKATGLLEQERANREKVRLQKERDRQNQIANMQKMQYDIDMAQVKTLQVLDKIEKPDGLDNEVTAILRDRINVASAAQMYLMTDFSDDKKSSTLFGIEHQNENLYRDTMIGRVSPITGMMITQDAAAYIYTGIEANYDLGPFKFTPSFAPGLYSQGDGKDLGHPLEFKSEVQLSMDLGKTTNFGMSYNHVSNASLGDKNPGANSYMFNFLKKF